MFCILFHFFWLVHYNYNLVIIENFVIQDFLSSYPTIRSIILNLFNEYSELVDAQLPHQTLTFIKQFSCCLEYLKKRLF